MKNKLIVLAIFLIIAPLLRAQIPRTISYQGVLTDVSGNPKPDGDYQFTFYLYETNTGGNAIWNETKTLNVSKGLFSTSLGDQTPFGAEVKFDKPYWLGIKIGDETELSPRIALSSAGYSLSSSTTFDIVDGKVVKSLNNLKDNVILLGSGGTTINSNGNTITISSNGTGGTGIQGVQNTNNTIDVTNPNGPTATLNLKVPLTLSGTGNNSTTFSSYNTGTAGIGLWGESSSGAGVVGKSSSWVGTYGETSTWFGVWGKATGTNGKGVLGESATSYGVWGVSPNGVGVVGESNIGEGVYGQTQTWFGVHGKATGENGKGVFGESATSFGVWGLSSNSAGVWGESQNFNGVVGVGSTNGIGIFGSGGVNGTGVYGTFSGSSTFGALGRNLSGQGSVGVYGFSPDGLAGWFDGDVHVVRNVGISGDLDVFGNKNFKIDHPLDPANKYLIHSCVESSERMNIYNGNIITDGSGSATVQLPEYFETLNIDYRYQLTTIGQQAQTWIENEISNNRFTIKTDKPNVKVSWQVTGVRNDEYAKQHPFIVEQEKEEKNKGKYLRPELFGQPEEKGINYVKVEKPEINQQKLMENQKEMRNDNK